MSSSKYVMDTGPGYLGIYRVNNHTVSINIDMIDHIDWRMEQYVYVVDEGGRLLFTEIAPEECLDIYVVGEEIGTGNIYLNPALLDALDVVRYDDIRMYYRDDGFVLVPVANDSILEDSQ